jgi:HEPN domain-containing protein
MTFDAEKAIAYWIDSAAYDLETGKTLLRTKRYPYALFFGHLAIEKVLKALVIKSTGEHAPYSHSLVMLAQKTGADIPEAMLDHLAEFMEFHTEARYPDAKMDFYRRCTKEFATVKFREIKEVYRWLLKKSGE